MLPGDEKFNMVKNVSSYIHKIYFIIIIEKINRVYSQYMKVICYICNL